MLKVNAQAFSFEVMNPRHMHDYHAFEDVRPPEGKVIIPGMLSNGANWVEHPSNSRPISITAACFTSKETRRRSGESFCS